ncbi:MAG TPA: invasion associated locus B family protein [Rhizomicrobium sp.]|jgi:hypothetical protein
MRSFSIFCVATVFALASSASAAEKPTPLGSFKNWSAFTAGTGDTKTCYALSQPVASDPKSAKRDAIYFLISDFPARKAKAEPQVVPGYAYPDNGTVSVTVGSDKFTFFTKNDGTNGSAWLKSSADEARLVAAMQKGSRATVTGASSNGTTTTDAYSLSGISAALQKAHAECKM